MIAADKRLLTDIEVAEMMGVSRSFVRRLLASGTLKRVRLPSPQGEAHARLLRIDREDVELLIRQNKTRVT